MEAAKMKNEKTKLEKATANLQEKENELQRQGKAILKKEKETRKLEVLEAEVLKRLRDTHVKQQQAIEEI